MNPNIPVSEPHPIIFDNIKQAWYADDAAADRSLKALREWWDHTPELGPAFSYYPNAVKTWLLVKEHHLDEAKDQFKDSGILITKRHFDAAIDMLQFISAYVKVCEWVNEIEHLSSIALTQPHAAYAAFTHGLKHKCMDISDKNHNHP